jgi:putative copper resistance protein D
MLDWSITFIRLIQLSSGALLFGVPLFGLYGPREASALMTRTIQVAVVGMVLATALSTVVQTSSLTGTPLGTMSFADLTWYLTETRIGWFNGLRLIGLVGYVILILAAAPSMVRGLIKTLLGGAILGSFALTGHGAENQWHSFSDFVHILMAGVWIGALASLCGLLFHASRNSQFIVTAVRGLNSFSRLGVAVVALLVASGVSNALFAFGISDPSALYRGEYGQILLIKLALLAGMVVLAAANRYWLVPALVQSLSAGNTTDAMRSLRRSVFTETSIAVIVLGFAAHLASTEPPGV